ncbi:hypothetical protein [Pedobacter psychrodurus]|uniref:hypothetical protein n=1 Tax=Pedobacter psychrodurus TaxID=2530456 RepID=UPI00292E4975|nr:hypothetical protein [Pedobacter psychrodurus]
MNLVLYLTLTSTITIVSYIFTKKLITHDIFYNSFRSQLDNPRIDELFDFQEKYAWIGFAFIPVWLLLKNFVVSLCLQIGLILNNTKLKSGATFKIAITAEFVLA